MKKSFFSGIALLAVASGACAQSQVTIYGNIDTFTQYTNTGNGYTAAIDSSGLVGTRWGVKGSEDLGDGRKLDFVLEQGFKSDSGAAADPARAFSRQSWIGLSNGLGQVRIGRQNALMFINEGRLDAFYGASMASGLNNFSTYTVRTDKTVSYFSPRIAAMQFQLYYGLGTGGGHRAPNGSYSGAVNYDTKRVHLTLVRQAVRNTLGNDTQTSLYAGASVDFVPLTAYLGYHKARSTLAGIDKDVLSLSTRFHLTPRTDFSLGYALLHDQTAKQDDAWQIGAMLHYHLSKRTQLYTTVSYLKNTGNAMYVLGGAAVAGMPLAHPGASPRGVQMGVLHYF